jgi:hypothetical protein
VDGAVAGMNQDGKNLRGVRSIIGHRHDQGQMSVCAATMCGEDGTRVGEEFLLEELKGGVGWLARDGGEDMMREGECRWCKYGRWGSL